MIKEISSLKRTASGLFIVLGSLFTHTAYADETDDFIGKIMEKRHIPGLQLAVVKNGKIIKLQGYGESNLQHSVKVTNQTIFPVNSMTKAFTGVAMMQLVEQGKLSLNDSIGKHLPELPNAWHHLTIKQLFAHTSGLPKIMSGRDTDLIANNDPQAAWAMVQTLPMEFKSNAQFSYNQTGYVILGKIINKLAGQPFTDFIKQNQLAKIGMPLTEQAGFAYFEEVIPNQSSYYRYGRDGSLRTAFGAFSPIMRTAAGMNTNAKELALYITALQKGELLSKSSLAALWDPVVLNNGRTAGFTTFENGYAIGWQVENRKQHRAVSSSGANANTLIFYPDDNLSIIVLTNLLGALPIQFVDEIASIYLPDMKKENGWQMPLVRLKQTAEQHNYKNIGEMITKLENEFDVYFNVGDINDWGYELVGRKNLQGALAVFKFNVEMHPQNANAFDSLGETYGALKQYKKALINYQQVLKLQPNNRSAKEIIKKIKQVMQ